MSWFFSVALPVDPASCHQAVGTVRAVAEAAGHASDLLAEQTALPSYAFGGLAAESYRAACGRLSGATAGLAHDTQAVAAALDAYAARVTAARDTLLHVRDAAVAAGFRVTPDDLVLWVPAPALVEDATYRRLERAAAQARAEAATATAEWAHAVEEHTTGRLAAPTTSSAVEGAL